MQGGYPSAIGNPLLPQKAKGSLLGSVLCYQHQLWGNKQEDISIGLQANITYGDKPSSVSPCSSFTLLRSTGVPEAPSEEAWGAVWGWQRAPGWSTSKRWRQWGGMRQQLSHADSCTCWGCSGSNWGSGEALNSGFQDFFCRIWRNSWGTVKKTWG